MGTSEFYRVVEGFREVADSLVVDTGRLGAEGRLILYVVPAAGGELDDDLAARLRAALRAQLSPRHVPDEIHQVPGIPRTLSGKKLEVPVRKILLGTEPERAADPNALANPEVLAYFGGIRGRPRSTPLGYLKEAPVTKRWQSGLTQATSPRANTARHKGVDRCRTATLDEAREALLAKAAQAWRDDPALDPRPWAGPRRQRPVLPARLLSARRHRGPGPRPRGWRRWPRPTPGWACACRRAGPWSRSGSRGTRTWTRSPRRAWWWTSSPTTCPTWSTRSPPG